MIGVLNDRTFLADEQLIFYFFAFSSSVIVVHLQKNSYDLCHFSQCESQQINKIIYGNQSKNQNFFICTIGTYWKYYVTTYISLNWFYHEFSVVLYILWKILLWMKLLLFSFISIFLSLIHQQKLLSSFNFSSKFPFKTWSRFISAILKKYC